jgi:hypothetical protein
MTDKIHTVEDLFSDSGPFDESEVVKAIHPFVTVQKLTNDIYFKSSNLTIEDKILVYGLTKKLLKIRGLIDKELITALEIHIKTGVKKGSVDPTFKNLKEKGFLVGKKEYEIPIHKISQIISILENKK